MGLEAVTPSAWVAIIVLVAVLIWSAWEGSKD
jgi:hypothetical protein